MNGPPSNPTWILDIVNGKTELELVEAALTGDVDSFGELYRRHYAAVVGVAYCVLGDPHLAEDAAQDAFAVACSELARLRHAEKFACWVRSIAIRGAKRMARSGRERGLSDDPPAAPLENAEDGRDRLVREAVMRLPISAREVVVLHYFNGLSHKQVATFLGTSPEAVHGRLVRARRKLADRLLRNGIGKIEL